VQDVIGAGSDVRDGGEGGGSRRGLLGAAAGGALAAFLAACGSSSDPQTADKESSDAQAPKGGHDLEILSFALTLEYIESDFYDEVVHGGLLSGRAGAVVKLIQGNEHEHVTALEALIKKIGGKPPERPQTQFPLAGGGHAALRLAARLENVGAAAYLGQLDAIENREVLAAALSIHSIEARHAAELNRLLGWQFAPDGAFASPRDIGEVTDAVQPFVV
jgi:rubrerythrin